jgi:ferrous iron transport protein A
MQEHISFYNTPSPTTLADLRPGEHATFVGISGGKHLTGRLIALGFTPGAEVEITHNHGHGPLLVTVRGTFVALGRGEASKILVERRPA